MTVELNLANLIFILIAMLSAFWALVKIIAVQAQKHLDARFSVQELARNENQIQITKRLDSIETVNREEAIQTQKHLDARFEVQELARNENQIQITRRLDNIETVNREDTSQWQRVERELMRLQVDMPLNYVRREDYIRGQSVIEAKLDGLGTKLENAQLRALKNAS